MSRSTAYIGMGSNLGDREEMIAAALKKLDEDSGVQVEAVSSVISTKACGGPPGQGDFLNAVVKVVTAWEPEKLLDCLQGIENELGRTREEHWGPRTLDLDLLMYADSIIETDRLTVPHPLLHERRFVLQPLAEIGPDERHPKLGQTIRELLEQLDEV